MNIKRAGGMLRRLRLIVFAVSLLGCMLAPAAAHAGKEGIYLSDSVYFTLEKVRFSEGGDDSILRFAVMLHNGGSTPVDYNYYGARVTDGSGFGYSAQLTGTQSARVQPGKDQEFAYESRVAKGVKADQLYVTMFGWSYGTTVAMNDIASFSVANALQEAAGGVQEAIVPLAQADQSLASDARVAFRIGSEYPVYESGRWNMYVDLVATNTGSSGVTLPAALKMRLASADGRQVTATAIDGADKSLLPGKPQKITVRAEIPDDGHGKGWTLQFYKMTGDEATVLDSLDLGGAAKPVAIGDSRTLSDSQGQETVKLKLESAVVSQSENGQWVRAKVTATNPDSRVVEIPALTANFQAANGGVSVTATDADTHSAYLSQGESETFTFGGLLPKGMTASDLQLVLFESRGGSTAGSNSSSGTTGATGSGAGTGSGSAASGNTSNTTAGSGSSGSTGSGKTTVPVFIALLDQADVYNQGAGANYTLGGAIDLPLDHKFDVAVSELRLYDNENYGLKTAVAKLKISNQDNTAYALPNLNLDLMDENGRVYTGTRQANVISQVATNSSYLVTYSFIVPEAEDGQPVTMRFFSGSDSIPLGAVKLGYEQDNTADSVWDTYPYRLTVKEADLTLAGLLSSTFAYTLKLDIGIERLDPIVADAATSKLQFDVVDSTGYVFATQTASLLGSTKLVDGDNSISFSNLKLSQFNSTNYVNVYEVIDTPNGTVKHKLGEIR